MSWIIRKQARDGSDEVGKVAGERFDRKEDAKYLAALLTEFSETHRFWPEEEPRKSAEELMDEGHAILARLDEVNEREDKERTMGSMALSSYRSDMYHRAMAKFNEALELMHIGEKETNEQ
jgi:hypothetical protein